MRKLAAIFAVLLLAVGLQAQQPMGGITAPGAAAPVTCGTTTATTNLGAGWQTYQIGGAPCTPASNVSVVDCQINTTAATVTGAYYCDVWDSDGTAGIPKTLLCTSTALTSVSPGWNTYSGFGTCNLSSGHKYWVGWYDSADTTIKPSSIAGGNNYYETGHIVPATFTSPISEAGTLSAYLDVE